MTQIPDAEIPLDVVLDHPLKYAQVPRINSQTDRLIAEVKRLREMVAKGETETSEQKVERLAKWLDFQFESPAVGNQVRALGTLIVSLRTQVLELQDRVEMGRS